MTLVNKCYYYYYYIGELVSEEQIKSAPQIQID